ncbi:MAG: hypothetical protein LUG45_12090 [Clostridiales bacterium]|nr:hypothetical protein [Clostridiales bacterium]
MGKRNWILMLAILVAVTLFSLLNREGAVTMSFEDEALVINGADEYSFQVAYDEIASIALEELPDLGAAVDGGEDGSFRYGVWENDTWGTYTLCLTVNMNTCIVLTLQDGSIYVFNYGDEDSTQIVYEDLPRALAEYGNDWVEAG